MASKTTLLQACIGCWLGALSCADASRGAPRTQSECADGPLSEALPAVIDVRTGVLALEVRLNDQRLPDFAGVGSLLFVERSGRAQVSVPLGLAPLAVIEARLPIGEYDVWYQPEAQVRDGSGVPQIGGRIAERVVVDASWQRAQLAIRTRSYALQLHGIAAEEASLDWSLVCGPTRAPLRDAPSVVAVVGASCELLRSNPVRDDPSAPPWVRAAREPLRFENAPRVEATVAYRTITVALTGPLDSLLLGNAASIALEAHTPSGAIFGRLSRGDSSMALTLLEGTYDVDLVYAFVSARGPTLTRIAIARDVALDRDRSFVEGRLVAPVSGEVRLRLPASSAPLRPAIVRAVYADAIVETPATPGQDVLRFEAPLPVGDAAIELKTIEDGSVGSAAFARLGRRTVSEEPQSWQIDATLFEPLVWIVSNDDRPRIGGAVIDAHPARRRPAGAPLTMPLSRTLLSEGDYELRVAMPGSESRPAIALPRAFRVHIDSETTVGIDVTTQRRAVRFTLDGAPLDPREADLLQWRWPDTTAPAPSPVRVGAEPIELFVDDGRAPTIALEINECAGRERRDALCGTVRVHACAR